jgi:ABC-2 type transport system permease protein
MRAFRSVALAVAWRSAHNYFTNPAMVMPGLLFPMFFFTAFAGGLSRVEQVPGFDYSAGYTAWVYGFVLLQASAFGGVFTGFGIARDFESGWARRVLLAAPARSGIVAGYWLGAVLRSGFTAIVVTIVALLVGMELGASGVDLVGLYTLALLVNAAAVLFAAGVAMRMRTMQAGPAMQVPVFLLLFLAPVWVPLELLSGWVHAAASVNPVTLFLNADRSLIAGAPEQLLAAFAAVAGLIAVTLWWSRGGLRSAERAA